MRRKDRPDPDTASPDERLFDMLTSENLIAASSDTFEEVLRKSETIIHEAIDAIKASEVNTRLGLNNQPVGVQEVTQVIAIVRKARIRLAKHLA